MGNTSPTLADWLQLAGGLALFVYAILVFVGDRVPALADAGAAARRRSWRLIVWLLRGLIEATIALGAGVEGIVLALWRGQPARATVAPPVNRFPLPDARYVAAPAPEPPPNTQTDPASVCLSAPSAPKAPDLPPALRSIMLDSELPRDERKAATSKDALLAALIAAGWGYSEIRAVLKNDSNTFRDEFEAARARLAQPPGAPRQTPLAERELPDGVEFPRRQPAP